MTRPESSAPDQPFPGAHSAVPGAHSMPGTSVHADGGRTTLALEAAPVATGHGLLIRLPVRAERVTVSKQVAIYERIVVRRRAVADVARVHGEVRREELRTSTQGDVDVKDVQ